MPRLIRWFAAPLVAATMMFTADAPQADAGGFSLHIGSGGGFYGYGPGYRSAYRPSFGYTSIRSFPSYGYSPYRTRIYSSRPSVYYRGPSFAPRHGYYNRLPGQYHFHYGRSYRYPFGF
ncbi:MAG: hypothetical protein AAF989_16325 [Planctomycetota bacterium]